MPSRFSREELQRAIEYVQANEKRLISGQGTMDLAQKMHDITNGAPLVVDNITDADAEDLWDEVQAIARQNFQVWSLPGFTVED